MSRRNRPLSHRTHARTRRRVPFHEVPADAEGPALTSAMWYRCAGLPREIDLGHKTVRGVKDCPVTARACRSSRDRRDAAEGLARYAVARECGVRHCGRGCLRRAPLKQVRSGLYAGGNRIRTIGPSPTSAKAKGVKFGRKPKLTAHQQREARGRRKSEA
jgi:hypothetical protein